LETNETSYTIRVRRGQAHFHAMMHSNGRSLNKNTKYHSVRVYNNMPNMLVGV